MTAIEALGLFIQIPLGKLNAWADTWLGTRPLSPRAAVVLTILGTAIVWHDKPMYGLKQAGIFWAAYYLFGDHGRRWGRKAKQWAKAQLTAIQEAAFRRETAEAR